MITVTKKVFLSNGRSGRKRLSQTKPAVQTVAPGRMPRISKLMALAIRFDGLLREGKVSDMSELARLAHVTQPRMTQILNLLHLAPDIQEELLFLPRTTHGRDPIAEPQARPRSCPLHAARNRRQNACPIQKRTRPRASCPGPTCRVA